MSGERPLWDTYHSAVCSITHLSGGTPVGQGTGFFVDNYLATNNHVFRGPGAQADSVRVQCVGSDGHTVSSTTTLSRGEFDALLRDGSPESEWDYALLEWESSSPSRLELAESSPPPIGSGISFLGFHFEDQNLSIGTGVVASRYVRAGVAYLQLDASVNHGNSGGPVIDQDSGRVIGIVTRKATGLTKQFDDLIASFDRNIADLSRSQATIRVGGIDPIQSLVVTQAQMRQVSLELRRSANVGIGYAYDIARVRGALAAL